MADIKISQLGAAVAVVDADVIPATANGVTVKVPASVLKEYAIGGTDISSIGDGTPTGAISALKSVKIEKTDIAPIETSVTSKAYAVGDQLYYNGMLYSVIAAIAQGETLVVDTNIELSDKVTEQIKALNGEVSTLNEALTNEVTTRATNGAHNLLPISASSQVVNGITFTVNTDGTVTVSGNATGYAYLDLVSDYVELGDYTISGCPSGGSESTYYLAIRMTQNTTWYRQAVDVGDGYTITPTDKANANRMIIRIGVESGTTISSPVVFKPMVRLATDTDPTYKPYAMTNQELTEQITWKLVANTTPFTNDLTKYNELMFCGMRGTAVGQTIIIPKDFITSNRQFRCDYGTSDNVTLTLNSPPSSGGRVNYNGTFFEDFSLFGR